jgi:ribonuclease D
MLAYARLDTHYLIPLRDRLVVELKERDLLPLAVEDFVRSCSVNGHQNGNHEEGFWRITGVQDLEPQQLAVLRELCAYRDAQAQAANQPAFKILSNQALLEVAQTRPRYIEELRLLPSLSERNVKRHGRSLLRAVERGLNATPPRRPAPQRVDERMAIRMDALRNWRKQAAHRMGVESDVVLPRDVLHNLAEKHPKTYEELAQTMRNMPWRYERFGEEIIQILRRVK